MSKIQRSYLQRYCVSILSVLIALLLGLTLDSLFKLEVSPLFFGAVVLSSWYGGLKPGLLATVLAVLVNNYFFIPPIYSLIPNTWTNVLQLIVFSLISLLISSLNSELHIAKQKSQAKLAKLTVSYRSLLETAYEGIWIFDQDGQTEYVNSQLAQMLGYSVEQMRDRSIFDFLENDAQSEIQQWLEQNQQHRQEAKRQFEVRLRRQDTSELWVIVSISSILNEQGKFSGMVAMLTNISERKHSEIILAQEQANRDRESQLLRAMLDILPVGVVISDAKGKFIEINSTIKAIWGDNAPFLDDPSQYHEYKGWWADTGKPIAAEEWTLARVLATGETIIGEEIDIESFDGQRKTILNSVVPIRDETGAIINAVAVNVDITERKQAEEKLRHSEALAKARAEELETIMETVPAAVWIAHDPQCHQMTVNRSAYKLMRLQPGSIMTATPASGEYTFPFKIQKNGQDVPLNELPMQQAGLTGQEMEGEFEFVFDEGDVQYIYGKAAPLRDQSGTIRGVLGAFLDITERKQAEEVLRQKQEWLDLAQAVGKIGSFEWNIPTNDNIWSKELEAIYGLQPGEFGGTYEDWKKWVHPDDLAKAHTDIVNSLKSGEFFTDFRVIWRDGSIHWLHARAKVYYDPEGKPLRMVGVNVDISDRKQAEEALRQSESRLRQLLESSIIGIIEAEPDKITFANDAFLQMLGYTQADLLAGNLRWQDMTPPEYSELDQAKVQEVFVSGVCTPFEKEYIHKDGSRVPILIGATLLTRNPFRWVCFVLDLSKRKQAEIALQESQNRLNLALEAADMGTWDWNIITGEIHWSTNLERIFGMKPSTFDGRYETFAAMLHPDDVTLVEQAIHCAIYEREEYNLECRFIKPDGQIRWAIVRGCVFYDQTGKPIRMVGVDLDITNRKQAEAALRQSELMFRTLADTMAQMFWITKPDGYHEYFNRRWYDYTGKTLKQAQGEGWLDILHPDDVQNTINTWQDCLQTGKKYEIEFRLRRAVDGEYRWHLGLAFPLRNQDGQIIKWFGSCTDIHEQKLVVEERAQALERERTARIELERANRMKDDFLAIVSHELRSPLNPILGWAKLLKSRRLDAAKTTQALETIERNAKLQARLIEDLLDVSRILRGKLSLNICTVDLVTTIESALETVRLAAETKSIHLHTEFAVGEVKVEGDPNRLQQIIWNLLTNAVKFTPEGGRVQLQLEKVGNFAQIQVTDTGKGISAEFLPFVFDRFRQADEVTTRKFGGLGLGLAIVRHLVELHGGSVQVTSPGENLGATFTVQLPLMVSANETLTDYPLIENTPNLQGVQIVIVDDDVDTLNLLTFILEQYGARVQAVNSAQEALQAIAQTQPHLLLSDIGMPTMDGYMLIEQVRSTTSASTLPAIALTAFAGEANSQKIISAGFQQHLTKPIEPAELAAVIANIIRISKNDK
ncbi:two-component hybrid sensor and regulator [Anabaenopsis circularis NIES-21]|uniref:Circadian input-output histidine kinase CikA n=1 Tax=Anabaenopsis circularis NIES-21 TaxID=1085406 RepID=A0A1Z4GLI5_9CYAN|nr:two-component hybrid sensor and regulator [Anabaenopsis circularis NIES-21]